MSDSFLHAKGDESALQAFSSREQTGLSASEVIALRERLGWNQLAEVALESACKRFLAHFSDVVVGILIAMAMIVLAGTDDYCCDTAWWSAPPSAPSSLCRQTASDRIGVAGMVRGFNPITCRIEIFGLSDDEIKSNLAAPGGWLLSKPT